MAVEYGNKRRGGNHADRRGDNRERLFVFACRVAITSLASRMYLSTMRIFDPIRKAGISVIRRSPRPFNLEPT
jgi:hypothetical protein